MTSSSVPIHWTVAPTAVPGPNGRDCVSASAGMADSVSSTRALHRAKRDIVAIGSSLPSVTPAPWQGRTSHGTNHTYDDVAAGGSFTLGSRTGVRPARSGVVRGFLMYANRLTLRHASS